VDNVIKLSFSPNKAPNRIAIFDPEQKGNAAFVRVLKYPQLDAISTKSFFKAQEATLLWNSQGSAILAWTHVDVDQTGKSYYGENGLHFLSAESKGEESTVVLKKDGPIHDVVWSPIGNHFLVLYGFMPAQATMFDTKCQPIVDFGSAPRNCAKFSPNGKLLCIGGFGNLQGLIVS